MHMSKYSNSRVRKTETYLHQRFKELDSNRVSAVKRQLFMGNHKIVIDFH